VIKIEHHRISLAAIHARMRLQKVADIPLVALTIKSNVCPLESVVLGLVLAIVGTEIFLAARSADRAPLAEVPR
jgi:hypothetical protein